MVDPVASVEAGRCNVWVCCGGGIEVARQRWLGWPLVLAGGSALLKRHSIFQTLWGRQGMLYCISHTDCGRMVCRWRSELAPWCYSWCWWTTSGFQKTEKNFRRENHLEDFLKIQLQRCDSQHPKTSGVLSSRVPMGTNNEFLKAAKFTLKKRVNLRS